MGIILDVPPLAMDFHIWEKQNEAPGKIAQNDINFSEPG